MTKNCLCVLSKNPLKALKRQKKELFHQKAFKLKNNITISGLPDESLNVEKVQLYIMKKKQKAAKMAAF